MGTGRGGAGRVPGARNGPQPRDEVEEQILLSKKPGATYMHGDSSARVLGKSSRTAKRSQSPGKGQTEA